MDCGKMLLGLFFAMFLFVSTQACCGCGCGCGCCPCCCRCRHEHFLRNQLHEHDDPPHNESVPRVAHDVVNNDVNKVPRETLASVPPQLETQKTHRLKHPDHAFTKQAKQTQDQSAYRHEQPDDEFARRAKHTKSRPTYHYEQAGYEFSRRGKQTDSRTTHHDHQQLLKEFIRRVKLMTEAHPNYHRGH